MQTTSWTKNTESVDHKKVENNSNAEYAKMEVSCQETMCQRKMSHKVAELLIMYNEHKE